MHPIARVAAAVVVAGAALVAQAPEGGTPSGGVPPSALTSPAIARDVRSLAGWQVLVDQRLLATEKQATERALELLGQMLAEIVRVVPAPATAQLQQVPLYVSPAYDGQRSGAEYHPGAAWLRDHGRDPSMARAVEFSGVADFEAEMRRMPNFALHELAHAYHDRVLPRGFANPAVLHAYAQAKAGGRYDRVARWHGNGRPNTTEAAYALTNAMEYFAEGTEAYFVRNDFAPFTRDELRAHDPALCDLLAQLWGVAATVPASAAVVAAVPAEGPAATAPDIGAVRGESASSASTWMVAFGGAGVALVVAAALLLRRPPR